MDNQLNEIRKRISNRKEELGMSYQELADKTGLSKSTLQRYITGDIGNLGLDKLEIIATALNISPATIMGWDDPSIVHFSMQKKFKADEFNYIDTPISAGLPHPMDSYYEFDKIYFPKDSLGKYRNRKDVVFTRVFGDSMNNIVANGSYIAFIREFTKESLQNGDIVIFQHDGEYSIKRFYKTDTKIIFKPDSSNPSFTDIVFDIESDDVVIIGKVIMYNVILD